LNDGIIEKIIKKNNKKKTNSKINNGVKIWHEKTQWGWNLKKNLKQKKIQLKKLGINLKD
jgi:hypothetical protein